MESSKTTSKLILTFLVLVAVVLLVSKIYFFNQGYSKATEDIRDKLEKSGLVTPLPEEVFSVFGIVESIDEKLGILMLNAYPPYDPLASGAVKTKAMSISISSDTKIVKRTTNEDDILSGKSDALTLKDEAISLSGLRTGDQVNVESKDNILNKESFVASKIILPE
ncbi:hypothetical protein HY948_03470 [Candidatus Gottesmanbacteria bacterium]|nr:hypothetical protein [Candidatus Gottesmanbacteria bacterium]